MDKDRLITEEEAIELRELFIDKNEVDEIKKWVNENLHSRFDWREKYHHLDIYNKVNFYRGILKRLQVIRRTPSCTTVNEVIDILYTLGYSLKRIIYLIWEWGFDLQNRMIVTQYIIRNKKRLQAERKKFMALIDDARSQVFQDYASQVKEEEARTTEIYLKQLKAYNDEMAELDPINDKAQIVFLRRNIKEVTDILNKVHGVDDIRKAVVKVAESKAIMREAKRLQGKADIPELNQIHIEEETGAQFLDDQSEPKKLDAGN